MVFCNIMKEFLTEFKNCHNPYFNRWFSAMWFYGIFISEFRVGHNPYFNRWFSAIILVILILKTGQDVTILILIDGFLQYVCVFTVLEFLEVTILILIDGFLQYL